MMAGVSGLTLLLIAVSVGFAAVIQSVSGFGYALVFVPIVSILAGPKVAVVAASAVGVLVNLSVVAGERQHVRRESVLVLVGAGIVGMPFGLWVLTHVDARTLQFVIGAAVIGLTAALMLGVTVPERRGIDLTAGFLSGVLATSTGTNGPPVVLALQARTITPRVMRATLTAVFLLQAIIALGAFAIAGQLTASVAAVVLVGIPGLVVGRVVGDRLFHRLDERRYGRVVYVLLFVAGALALIEAALA